VIFEDVSLSHLGIGEDLHVQSLEPQVLSWLPNHSSFAPPTSVDDFLDIHARSGSGIVPSSGGDTGTLTTAATSGGEEIVVIGVRFIGGASGSGGGGGYIGRNYEPNMPTDDPGGAGEETQDPNCQNTNRIDGTVPPDGATYYSPEGVDDDYLIGALNHIGDIYANNPLNKVAVTNEIISMYTNPSNPFFVDFKDWGTAAGPAGSLSGGTVTYYSQAAGTNVSGSAFEAFGNYFFGVLCTWGGLAPEEIWAAAAWYSESGPFWEGDDPQDVPQVNNGIAAAQSFLAGSGQPMFTVVITNCE